MQPTRSILLAEEDVATRAFLADNLTADGYRVLQAGDRMAALATLDGAQPDLVMAGAPASRSRFSAGLRRLERVALWRYASATRSASACWRCPRIA
jgi:DNA-binding response OmpR family regulator